MADSRRFALGNQLGNKVLFLVTLPAKKKNCFGLVHSFTV